MLIGAVGAGFTRAAALIRREGMLDRFYRNALVLALAAGGVLAAGPLSGCASGVSGLPILTADPVDGGQPSVGDDTPDTTGDPAADPSIDLPANDYCQAVADWAIESSEFEDAVLALINARRSNGADCGSSGSFEPADPLTMNGSLRCAARNHSMDMALRDFFAHADPDGQGPGTRIEAAEYEWMSWGENIAWGQTTPASVVDGWMNSPGHCANIMSQTFTETGIGFYEGNLWTQTFGSPR